MKFRTDWLFDTMGDPEIDVLDRIIENSRWSILHERIIKFQDKFYQANYQVGATEYQDERPYDCESSEMECPEVVPVEKVVIEYVVKK